MTWQILLSRIRMPLVAASLVFLFVGGSVGVPGSLRLAIVVAVYVVALRAGTLRRDPIVMRAPIVGRWRAMNSPATKVPSHGLQAYGQSYAIDVVHEPHEGSRPKFGWWPLTRRATSFPGFGQPVLAAADGGVIGTHGWERDHWSATRGRRCSTWWSRASCASSPGRHASSATM